ncbi:MAG: NUDIX hydrolase [Anaerolineae bacterium]|nr:NUDIX hydrolase [Anaerolineae bacterium]
MRSVEDQPGYRRAVAKYGRPVMRICRYDVSADTYDYWERVLSRRLAEVVLIVMCNPGRYLVHTKAFYPPGTYRLLSGGLVPGEDLLVGTRRELQEETGLEGEVVGFLATQAHHFQCNGVSLVFYSYLFLIDAEGGQPVVSDDSEQITAFREVDRQGLRALAERLDSMNPAWAEWGHFRATSHWLAWELLGSSEAHGG